MFISIDTLLEGKLCIDLFGHAGGALYKDVPSDHDQYSLITHDVSAALTEDRVLHIRGA